MPVIQRYTRGVLGRALGRLRFPSLFLLTSAAFLVDLVVPDPIPFADEIFLVLLTALLGSIKNRHRGRDAPAEADGDGHPSDTGAPDPPLA